jgi:hypothetical protein
MLIVRHEVEEVEQFSYADFVLLSVKQFRCSVDIDSRFLHA